MSCTEEDIGIHVAIRGHCQEFFPDMPEEFKFHTQSEQNLRQIMTAIGIKPQLIMGVLVNGKLQKKDYRPANGDKIILLSPPSGG